MAINIRKWRRWIKALTQQYLVPSVAPSADHTDGSWSVQHLYDREMIVNTTDKKCWIRMADEIIELLGRSAAIDLFYALRLGVFYFWRNATDRANQTGMTEGQKGLQGDTRIVYIYESGSWVEYYSLDAVVSQPNISISHTWNSQSEQDAQTGMLVGALGRRLDTNNVYRWTGTSWVFWFRYDALAEIQDNVVTGGDFSCESKTVINDTNFYVFLDTSSLSADARTYIRSTLVDEWFKEFRANNQDFTGKLIYHEIGDEKWLDWPRIIQETYNDYGNVIFWVFGDESNSVYHNAANPVDFDTEPTTDFTNHYNNFVNNILPAFQSFTGIVYAVPSESSPDPGFDSNAVINFHAHIVASINGGIVAESEFIQSYSGDISIVKTENPYTALGTPLKELGWAEKHDFETGIEDVSYVDFKAHIESLLSSKSNVKLKLRLFKNNGTYFDVEADISQCMANMLSSSFLWGLDANKITPKDNKDVNIETKLYSSILHTKRGTDTASTNLLALTGDGNSYVMSTIANQIHNIHHPGQREGSYIFIDCPVGTQIKHNKNTVENTLTYYGVIIPEGADWVADNEYILILLLHREKWRIVGRQVSSEVPRETASITLTTTSSPENVSINMEFSGTVEISWGDGSAVESLTSGATKTHSYTTAGQHTFNILSSDLSNVTKIDFDEHVDYANLSLLDKCVYWSFYFSNLKSTADLNLPSHGLNVVYFGVSGENLTTVDLTNFTGFGGGIYLNTTGDNTPNVDTFVFPATSQNKLKALYLQYKANLGTGQDLDLTGYKFEDAADFRVYNFDYNNLFFPNTSNTFSHFYLQYANSVINLDLSVLSQLSGDIRIAYCDSLTSLSLPSNSTASITTFLFYGNSTITSLDLRGLKNASGDIAIYSNTLLSTVYLPQSTGVFNEIRISNTNNCNVPNIADLTGANNNCKFDLRSNNWDAAKVNEVLVLLDATGWTATTVSISINNNTAPDGTSGGFDGITAKSNLQGKGWTVITD